MTLNRALFDLERYAFIWKLKLVYVHWIAEPFTEMVRTLNMLVNAAIFYRTHFQSKFV